MAKVLDFVTSGVSIVQFTGQVANSILMYPDFERPLELGYGRPRRDLMPYRITSTPSLDHT